MDPSLALPDRLKRLINTDVEQAALSALLFAPDRAVGLRSVLAPEDFGVPVHGEIFGAIASITESGALADPLTLAKRFAGHPDLEGVGGAQYLADLAAAWASPSMLDSYVTEIRDSAHRRRLVTAAAEVLSEAADAKVTTPELALRLVGPATDAQGRRDRLRSRRQAADAVYGRLSDDAVTGTRCYPTGLACLDDAMLGGIYAGKVYGVEGLDKRGKSTLAGTVSYNLGERDVPHLYIAMEMGSEDLEIRHIARSLGVASERILRRSPHLAPRMAEYCLNARRWPLYLDMPGGTLAELKAEVARAIAQHGITGFVLDYWQLVQGAERGQSEQAHLRAVAQWVADFCRRHRLWSIVVSQLNDDGSGFGSRRGLEMAADQVYVLNRDLDSPYAWLMLRVSRYCKAKSVGAPDAPVLRLDERGPWFEDISIDAGPVDLFDDDQGFPLRRAEA